MWRWLQHPIGLLAGVLALLHPGAVAAGEWLDGWQATNQTWRGVHFWLKDDNTARDLLGSFAQLNKAGVNTIILEVNHRFDFESQPELREAKFITKARARELTAAAHAHGIRLIPEFNCLGHQSFGRRAVPLLLRHPEFNETPGLSAADTNIYCLSWCPNAPGVNKVVFSLIDELIAGFEVDAFHVGMDEVYLLASERCSRCRGGDPAKLFAQSVNDLHRHIVGERKIEMLMWADRVIGPKYQGASRYDNAQNDTSACIDVLPRDIVMCDWHYEWRREYSSVPFLLGKGFRVWPAGFTPVGAAKAFSDYSRHQTNQLVLGFLATTWNQVAITNAAAWPPIKDVLPDWLPGQR